MDHRIGSREEWTAASKALLVKEKQLTRLRDQLCAERQALPWVKVDKVYEFDTTKGRKTLADLFDGRSQLIVYHFMWRWDLGMGCDGCSFQCDHVDGANLHLAHHDVTFVAVSRGRLADLQAYRKRMGWRFTMVSSYGSDFNYDYHVSFTPEEVASKKACYNFEMRDVGSEELPGLSAFYKNDKGEVFHTYSSYARGNEETLGAYMYLDIAPLGRNETTGMGWMKRHDEYERADQAACCQSPPEADKRA
jgi:predicted dithiol-disulfide oxidoreductase (DUF899 family)